MDVLCAGMYRACSTWQYVIVSHLVEQHLGGRRLGYLTGDDYAALEARDGPGRPGRWRVLKSHEGHPRFAAALAEGRAVAVYAQRDLRDVIYSMLHKRGVAFAPFVRQGMVHQVLANDAWWRSRPRLLVQKYDAIMARPAAGVARLAEHLGLAVGPEGCAALAEEYSLEANRRRAAATARRLRAAGLDADDPANRQRFDGRTLLHWNHLRDGRTGSWRELASPGERRALGRLISPWLVAHGYEPDGRWADGPRGLGLERDLAIGAVRCTLRCAALEHPRTAAVLKRWLGLTPHAGARPGAAPVPAPCVPAPGRRVDEAGAAGRGPRPGEVQLVSRPASW